MAVNGLETIKILGSDCDNVALATAAAAAQGHAPEQVQIETAAKSPSGLLQHKPAATTAGDRDEE